MDKFYGKCACLPIWACKFSHGLLVIVSFIKGVVDFLFLLFFCDGDGFVLFSVFFSHDKQHVVEEDTENWRNMCYIYYAYYSRARILIHSYFHLSQASSVYFGSSLALLPYSHEFFLIV